MLIFKVFCSKRMLFFSFLRSVLASCYISALTSEFQDGSKLSLQNTKPSCLH